MKLNKLAMALGLGVALTAGSANAINQGSGTVKFNGSIIDAPCSIKNSNIEVNMGNISSHQLKNNGRSESKFFKIELEGCTADVKNGLVANFTGQNNYGTASQGLLGIEGTAKGAAIAITNGAGKVIPIGGRSDIIALVEGSNELNFGAFLKGTGATDDNGDSLVIPGNFTAIANFSLNYL